MKTRKTAREIEAARHSQRKSLKVLPVLLIIALCAYAAELPMPLVWFILSLGLFDAVLIVYHAVNIHQLKKNP